MSAPESPRRVRITHPRTDAVRRVPHRPAAREIDEQTSLGEVYMSALIRAQGRLAVVVCAAIAVLLFGTALLGVMTPRFATLRIGSVPLPWVLLGFAVYPMLIAIAIYCIRQAERNERVFSELAFLRAGSQPDRMNSTGDRNPKPEPE